LELLQVDDTCDPHNNKDDSTHHNDVPVEMTPTNDHHTSDDANKRKNDPSVCMYVHNIKKYS